MFEVFHYEFMQNAFFAAILTCIACGVIGVLVVSKKIVSVTGGISHASFGGIGLSYYLGLNPLVGLLPFSLVSAFVLGFLSRKTKVSEDTAIGILWSMGVALGIVLIYLTPGYAPDLMTYLFGNILTVPSSDIRLMASIDLIILALVFLLYKEFLALSFDEEYTTVAGAPTGFLYMALLGLIALTVVAMIKVVGIILIIAMLTIPASLSRRITHSMKRMMIVSAAIGIVMSLAGLMFSYWFNLPSGAAIILVMGSVYLSVVGVSEARSRFFRTGPDAHG